MISQRQVVLYTFKRTLFWVGTHNDSRQMPFRPLRTGDMCGEHGAREHGAVRLGGLRGVGGVPARPPGEAVRTPRPDDMKQPSPPPRLACQR
jgi:hypothetical protein